MDLFKWSVPFLMEKVSDMLVYLTNKHLKDPIEDKAVEKVNVEQLLKEQQEEQKKEAQTEAEKKAARMAALRAKVRVFARMNRIFKTIR